MKHLSQGGERKPPSINRGEAKGIKQFPLMGKGQRAHMYEMCLAGPE